MASSMEETDQLLEDKVITLQPSYHRKNKNLPLLALTHSCGMGLSFIPQSLTTLQSSKITCFTDMGSQGNIASEYKTS